MNGKSYFGIMKLDEHVCEKKKLKFDLAPCEYCFALSRQVVFFVSLLYEIAYVKDWLLHFPNKLSLLIYRSNYP